MFDLVVNRLGILIADGVARLDFLRLNEIDAQKKRARMAPSIRLSIPVTCLVQVLDLLVRLQTELLQQPQAGAPSTPPGSSTSSAPESAIGSVLATGLPHA